MFINMIFFLNYVVTGDPMIHGVRILTGLTQPHFVPSQARIWITTDMLWSFCVQQLEMRGGC